MKKRKIVITSVLIIIILQFIQIKGFEVIFGKFVVVGSLKILLLGGILCWGILELFFHEVRKKEKGWIKVIDMILVSVATAFALMVVISACVFFDYCPQNTEIILKEENCDKTVKLLECNSNFFPSGKIYIRVAPFVWRCKGQIGTKMTKYILEGEKYTAYYDEIKDYIKIELLLEEQ